MIRNLLLVLVIVSNGAFAQTHYITDKFTIKLPDGWMQVSGETVDFLIQELKYQTHAPAYKNYDYVYQRKTNDTLFTLPYILVQINDAQRLTSGELKSSGGKNFQYDPATNYLWGYRDSVIEVIIPTQEGTVNVFCYSSKADFPANKEQFMTIIQALHIDPPLAYKANFFRDIPYVNTLVYDIKGSRFLIALLAAALIASRLRFRKHSKAV